MPRDLTKPRRVPGLVKAEREFWLTQLSANSSDLVESIRPQAADKGPGFWKSMIRNKETGCELHFVYMKRNDGSEFYMEFDPEVTDFAEACKILEEKTLQQFFERSNPGAPPA
jgi:hypothetical protein